jgi:hypothetical protein
MGYLALVMLSRGRLGPRGDHPDRLGILCRRCGLRLGGGSDGVARTPGLRKFGTVPEETVETLKEDVEWLKSRKN